MTAAMLSVFATNAPVAMPVTAGCTVMSSRVALPTNSCPRANEFRQKWQPQLSTGSWSASWPARSRCLRNSHKKTRHTPLVAVASAESPVFLEMMTTKFNRINLFEYPPDAAPNLANARMMILDETMNVHSVYRPHTSITASYWDGLASVAALVTDPNPSPGAKPTTIAIFGLGAGTCPRIIHEFWPSVKMYGWELDDVVVDMGRKHMGMQALEDSGALTVFVADALTATPPPGSTGFDAIIVDIFIDGVIPEEFTKVATWRRIEGLVNPGGHVIMNLAGVMDQQQVWEFLASGGRGSFFGGGGVEDLLEEDQPAAKTLLAMKAAFSGLVSRCALADVNSKSLSANVLALAGTRPNLKHWEESLPNALKQYSKGWVSF
eukprot:jgi/Mesvir1/24559/Mv21894-RA.1